jgi:hypothetical protein
VAYIHDGRPQVASRSVFLRVHAPLVGLSHDGVGMVVACAGKRAGVRASAHRLCHSAATAMFRAGASLSEVGQVLRHADVATTAIYGCKGTFRFLPNLVPTIRSTPSAESTSFRSRRSASPGRRPHTAHRTPRSGRSASHRWRHEGPGARHEPEP